MTWNFTIVCRPFFCKYSLKSIKIPFFFSLLSNICVQFFSRTLRRTNGLANDSPFIDRITKLIKCLNFAQPNGKGKSRRRFIKGIHNGRAECVALDLLLIFSFRSTPAKVGCNFKLLALHQRILLWTVNTETPPMTSYSSFSRGEDRSLLETYRSALGTDRIIYRNRAFRLWSSFRTRHSPPRWNSKGTEDVYTCLRNCFSPIFRRDNVELNSQRIYGIHFLEDVFARVA